MLGYWLTNPMLSGMSRIELARKMGCSAMELRDSADISAASIVKLGRGANITKDVLLKICEMQN